MDADDLFGEGGLLNLARRWVPLRLQIRGMFHSKNVGWNS